MLAGVLELQHLHEEFDVDDAARPAFQVAAGGRFFQPGRMWRISSASLAAPAVAEGGVADRRRGRARPPAASRTPRRALHSACRSQSCPLPSAK